jgi:PAS domain S-box-containing protein
MQQSTGSAARHPILVVDDNAVNRDLMACILEESAYRPIIASSGEEALRIAREERPALVIADVLMSGMNGFELGRALRESPELAALPLVFWTAHYDSAEVRRIARSLGVADVLPKPCDNVAVQSAVARVIAERNRVGTPLSADRFEHEQVRVLSDKLVEKADELERTRGQLRDSEDRFQLLVSNIPGAIYRRSAERDMAIELASDAIEELTGFSAASLMAGAGGGFMSIVHPQDRDQVRADLRAARDGDGHYGLAYRIVRADGHLAWVGDRGQVVAGDEGEPDSQYGTLSDITARKQLEADHARMEMELRMAQRLEAVGQLAAGVAHEINTPIQFIGDGVTFLQEAFEDLERVLAAYHSALDAVTQDPAHAYLREDMEAVEEAADLAYLHERVPAACARTLEGVERVASIVRAMKEFAHPQSEQAPANLNRALATTLEVARNEYKYVARVVTELGDLPDVVCNVSDINQVFLNLIVNAAHAIGDARPESSDQLGTIRIATRCAGDTVLITVADDGGGIPPEIHTRIFDPFFTTKPVGRGSGQGLAIARAVVERHGGSLRFETRAGAGTTFTIGLPIAGARAAGTPGT